LSRGLSNYFENNFERGRLQENGGEFRGRSIGSRGEADNYPAGNQAGSSATGHTFALP